MKVVLDTNALHRDYFLRKPGTVALAREQGRGCFNVVVPEVVVQEHIKHFQREREKLKEKLIAVLADVRSLVTNDVRAPELQPQNDEYPEVLRKRLDELGFEVAPHPAVAHAALVERAVAGRRPFSGEGQRGYHDVLVWETARGLCRSDPVVLVSRDAAAFGQDHLHPDLQEELRRDGFPARITLANSVPDVVTMFVNPLLERLTELERALNTGAAPVNPREWLAEHESGQMRIDGLLRDWLQPEDFVQERTEHRGGRTHSMSAHWRRTTEVKSSRASRARRLANGQVLVQLEVELAGEASYEDYVMEDHVLYESSSWEQPHGVRAELQLLIDLDAGRIEAAEIEHAELSD